MTSFSQITPTHRISHSHSSLSDIALIEQVHRFAHPLRGFAEDYDPVLEQIGDAPIVLLGEASHGTHEFYEARVAITKRLIEEKQFSFVAVEADWPDAFQANVYVQGQGTTSEEALSGFQRFPKWMWRNTVIRDFLIWLQDYHQSQPAFQPKVGFYGLDLYSLHASMEAVISYLQKTDPPAAERAKNRYACFDHFGMDPQSYGYQTAWQSQKSCEEEVALQFFEMRYRQFGQKFDSLKKIDLIEAENIFSAEQNARLVKNAETYYRELFRGQVPSWNIRDEHMMETLQALLTHRQKQQKPAKVVVWAHNSHIGDARATEMKNKGELNLGQLMKQAYGKQVVSIGFSTHHGTVMAAKDWDHPGYIRKVQPALPGSYESLLHQTRIPCFYLDVTKPPLAKELSKERLERAIGVIYRPETERASHYFYASLPAQFDGIIHFDVTRAVEPLDKIKTEPFEKEEWPETYPSGL